MRVTVISYSNTGKTEAVAAELAKQLDADLLKLTCLAYTGASADCEKRRTS